MSGYRKNVIDAVAGSPNHPVHHISMQAHHLISKKSVMLTGKKEEFEDRGYDINIAENVALFPSVYEGACHLEMQLHRSDHKDAGPEYDEIHEGDDGDNAHSRVYHNVIKTKYLDAISKKIDKYCSDDYTPRELQADLDDISQDIYEEITDLELLLVDRKVSIDFKSGNLAGCRNQKTKKSFIFAKDNTGENCVYRTGEKKGSHFPNVRKSGFKYTP